MYDIEKKQYTLTSSLLDPIMKVYTLTDGDVVLHIPEHILVRLMKETGIPIYQCTERGDGTWRS